jgi:antitoxin component YwqK of YwqJK toxin-antitoxin module
LCWNHSYKAIIKSNQNLLCTGVARSNPINLDSAKTRCYRIAEYKINTINNQCYFDLKVYKNLIDYDLEWNQKKMALHMKIYISGLNFKDASNKYYGDAFTYYLEIPEFIEGEYWIDVSKQIHPSISVPCRECTENHESRGEFIKAVNITPHYWEKITKIYITRKSFSDNHVLLNPKDSTYVKMEKYYDMGYCRTKSYTINDSLPDGKYEVYLNDTLERVFYFKNGVRDSIWTRYYFIGGYIEETYRNGKLTFPVRIYNDDKKLVTISDWYSDSLRRSFGYVEAYYTSGKVKERGFDRYSLRCVTENYDEKGRITMLKVFNDTLKVRPNKSYANTYHQYIHNGELIVEVTYSKNKIENLIIYGDNKVPMFSKGTGFKSKMDTKK